MGDASVIDIITTVGQSGIFLYLFFREKQLSASKDGDLKDLNQKVLDAFMKNTEAITKLTSNIDSLGATVTKLVDRNSRGKK